MLHLSVLYLFPYPVFFHKYFFSLYLFNSFNTYVAIYPYPNVFMSFYPLNLDAVLINNFMRIVSFPLEIRMGCILLDVIWVNWHRSRFIERICPQMFYFQLQQYWYINLSTLLSYMTIYIHVFMHNVLFYYPQIYVSFSANIQRLWLWFCFSFVSVNRFILAITNKFVNLCQCLF